MSDPGRLALFERLGLSPHTKAVVAHQDDVGMCHGANVAFAKLAGAGFITSGSVMVPCPWFEEIAEGARENPAWDLGVHLTLTSEWRHYRWRPLTDASDKAGLCDADGYMWRSAKDVRANAVPAAVDIELRAQIDRALAAGIDMTHLDCHMGTALCPEFADIYIQLGQDYDVPVLFPGAWEGYGAILRLGDGDAAGQMRRRKLMEGRLNPIFDTVVETAWSAREESDAAYRTILEDIQPGLTFLALHCNAPGDIETIDPRRAHARWYEYQRFQDPAFLEEVGRAGLTMIGFRDMRDAMRSANKRPQSHAAPESETELRA